MPVSRRAVLGRFAAVAALPLIAACSTESQTASPTPTARSSKLVLAPLATPTLEPTAEPTLPPTPAPTAVPTAKPAIGRPMYQMDAQHTGRSPNKGPRAAKLMRSFNTGNFQIKDGATTTPNPDIQSSAAIGPDGTIYLANHQGVLFALRDPHSGPNGGSQRQTLELAWRCHPPESSSWHATPALSPDGTVYLGFSRPGTRADIEGTLYALRAPSGNGVESEVLWAVNVGPGRQTSSPTLGPDGTIYVVSGTGWLFAVTPEGEVRWSVETGPALKAAPALSPDGSAVYVSSMNGKLYAVQAPTSDGDKKANVRWTFSFADFPGRTPPVKGNPPPAGADGVGSGASPTVAPDGMVYVSANNSNFYALTPEGRLLWLFEAEREIAGIWSTAALSADASTLYFGANKGGLYALNRQDGSLQWRFGMPGSIYNSPALDAEGVVYTGSTIGTVFAIDGQTGEQIFAFDAGAAVWTAPAIRPDGSLVVADRNGKVLVLG
ncbi:MAG TPA: PQQ-binding-like beta-propeller repeat protein [Chloroflexota bacterium]|nr:PQQ-binding-like beta-propeller repeat protein [Chloroflexota bacterium]